MPLERAAPYLMPETFSVILSTFKLPEPEWGPDDLLQTYGTSFFDDLFAAYYGAFRMNIVWATRAMNGRTGRLPLITRKSVHLWLRNYIAAQPIEFETLFNELLHDCPELIDPMTEVPFGEKTIPRSCFPAQPIPTAQEFVKRALNDYMQASEQVIAKVRPVAEELQLARQDLTNAREEARMHREMEVNARGGYRTDEVGNMTYQEGWQWRVEEVWHAAQLNIDCGIQTVELLYKLFRLLVRKAFAVRQQRVNMLLEVNDYVD